MYNQHPQRFQRPQGFQYPQQGFHPHQQGRFNLPNYYYQPSIGMSVPQQFYPQPFQQPKVFKIPERVPNPLFIVEQKLENSCEEFSILDEESAIQSSLLKTLESPQLEEEKKIKSLEEQDEEEYNLKKKQLNSNPFLKFVMMLWFGSIMGYKNSYYLLFWIYNQNIDGIHDPILKYISEYYYFNNAFPPGLVYHPLFPNFDIQQPIKKMSIDDEKEYKSIVRQILQHIILYKEENVIQYIVAKSLIRIFI